MDSQDFLDNLKRELDFAERDLQQALDALDDADSGSYYDDVMFGHRDHPVVLPSASPPRMFDVRMTPGKDGQVDVYLPPGHREVAVRVLGVPCYGPEGSQGNPWYTVGSVAGAFLCVGVDETSSSSGARTWNFEWREEFESGDGDEYGSWMMPIANIVQVTEDDVVKYKVIQLWDGAVQFDPRYSEQCSGGYSTDVDFDIGQDPVLTSSPLEVEYLEGSDVGSTGGKLFFAATGAKLDIDPLGVVREVDTTGGLEVSIPLYGPRGEAGPTGSEGKPGGATGPSGATGSSYGCGDAAYAVLGLAGIAGRYVCWPDVVVGPGESSSPVFGPSFSSTGGCVELPWRGVNVDHVGGYVDWTPISGSSGGLSLTFNDVRYSCDGLGKSGQISSEFGPFYIASEILPAMISGLDDVVVDVMNELGLLPTGPTGPGPAGPAGPIGPTGPTGSA